jgi:hypothetical protein
LLCPWDGPTSQGKNCLCTDGKNWSCSPPDFATVPDLTTHD